jgi:hypothetical protein
MPTTLLVLSHLTVAADRRHVLDLELQPQLVDARARVQVGRHHLENGFRLHAGAAFSRPCQP